MKSWLGLFFCLPVVTMAQEYRLAPPRVKADAVFFRQSAHVEMDFDLDGAQIWYTLNEAATARSTVYKKALRIKKSCTLSAIAVHPDYQPSESVQIRLIHTKNAPFELSLGRQPNASYPGGGPAALCDGRKGGGDLHDGRWMGFSGNEPLELTCRFSRKNTCKKLIVSTLSDFGAWIMPMREIQVWGLAADGKWVALCLRQLERRASSEAPDYHFMVELPLQSLNTDQIKITVIPYGDLPPGHPGAGSPAWLFLDEIAFQ